ncbi:MAG: hypothetical protein HY865_22535 [Chloroflexi bacterium]|nr:hypothetical protein [Chloroflexota bacterium]
MNRTENIFKRIADYFSNLSFKTYVTIFLEGLGLVANIIAIVTFFGANNTPRESPNFSINSQEFFLWSFIAVIYTLGMISAKVKRRWKRLLFERGYVENYYDSGASIFRSPLHRAMFNREFSFTIVIVFPLTILYVRAMIVAANNVAVSPWASLNITLFVCVPVTFCVMLASSFLDRAISLYDGD